VQEEIVTGATGGSAGGDDLFDDFQEPEHTTGQHSDDVL
jgi:hypothetical protein